MENEPELDHTHDSSTLNQKDGGQRPPLNDVGATILATFNACQASLASAFHRHRRVLSLGTGINSAGWPGRAALRRSSARDACASRLHYADARWLAMV